MNVLLCCSRCLFPKESLLQVGSSPRPAPSASAGLTLYSSRFSFFYHFSFSSLVLTCSLFSFSLLPPLHLGFSARSAPPAHSSCFRTRQRLLRDYAWVGLNDYIKPRTQSRASRWDLMCRRGGGKRRRRRRCKSAGEKMTTVSQWEHDNPPACPAEMKSRGSTR